MSEIEAITRTLSEHQLTTFDAPMPPAAPNGIALWLCSCGRFGRATYWNSFDRSKVGEHHRAEAVAAALAGEPMPVECRHLRLVEFTTIDDTIRLQGRARVHLCNDCGTTLEVPT